MEVGQGEGWKAAGDAAEFAADGFDRQVEDDADAGANEKSNDGGRDSPVEARQDEDDGQCAEAEAESGGVKGSEVGDEQADSGEEFAWNRTGAKAEEVLDLGGSDEDGDAVGKADDDHPGNEPDGSAEAGESHEEEDHSGHHGDHGEAAHAETGDDSGDDDDECAGGAADLGARAAEGGDEEPGNDGGVEAGLGSDSGGDAEGHGEGQGNKSDGEAGEQVVHEHLGGIGSEGQDGLGQIRIAYGHGSWC